jgi:hypothetical protein
MKLLRILCNTIQKQNLLVYILLLSYLKKIKGKIKLLNHLQKSLSLPLRKAGKLLKPEHVRGTTTCITGTKTNKYTTYQQ